VLPVAVSESELVDVSFTRLPVPVIAPLSVWLALLLYLKMPLFAIAPAYVPAPSDPAPPMISVPPLIVVVPVKVFTPEAIHVPAPFLVRFTVFAGALAPLSVLFAITPWISLFPVFAPPSERTRAAAAPVVIATGVLNAAAVKTSAPVPLLLIVAVSDAEVVGPILIVRFVVSPAPV
jgi:hypothetical protein